eukprot:TRINITY_DN43970_c0_g1_i1.p1 TRINITY_DN43970_c0_g1~~TRINITY_DN43970_c0_g1_i1.p1  ORF type:complete len:422 (-),score=116.47 TRINITY_DN43970_c0_g1_i1:38-1303(-)
MCIRDRYCLAAERVRGDDVTHCAEAFRNLCVRAKRGEFDTAQVQHAVGMLHQSLSSADVPSEAKRTLVHGAAKLINCLEQQARIGPLEALAQPAMTRLGAYVGQGEVDGAVSELEQLASMARFCQVGGAFVSLLEVHWGMMQQMEQLAASQELCAAVMEWLRCTMQAVGPECFEPLLARSLVLVRTILSTHPEPAILYMQACVEQMATWPTTHTVLASMLDQTVTLLSSVLLPSQESQQMPSIACAIFMLFQEVGRAAPVLYSKLGSVATIMSAASFWIRGVCRDAMTVQSALLCVLSILECANEQPDPEDQEEHLEFTPQERHAHIALVGAWLQGVSHELLVSCVTALKGSRCFEDVLHSYGAMFRSVVVNTDAQKLMASLAASGGDVQQDLTRILQQFPIPAKEVTSQLGLLMPPANDS